MCSEPDARKGVTRAKTFFDGDKDYSAFVNFNLV